MNVGTEKETVRKILVTATALFARSGYDGVSVRDICSTAGISMNAVHYHFQSKQKLYETILQQFHEDLIASAKRILNTAAPNAIELRMRLQIFMEQMLGTLLDNKDLLLISHIEFMQSMQHVKPEIIRDFMQYPLFLIEYLEQARLSGLLKTSVDTEVLASMLLKPVYMLVLFCDNEHLPIKHPVRDVDYQQHWINQMLDNILTGALV